MQQTATIIDQNREQAYNAYYVIERDRLYQDETTWVAEALDAPLEKERVYTLVDGELHSPEGIDMRGVFDTSVEHYRELAEREPFFTFQYERSLHERKEYEIMREMAMGKGSNTMLVWSTYPRELYGIKRDVLGYQHMRKLGFLRAIKRLDDGSISMWTHTFDGDDHEGIEAMYGAVGRSVNWGQDPLAQRVRIDLESDDQALIGEKLLYRYDETLNQKYGGNWYAGRSEADRREAVAFVEAQTDLMKDHIDQLLFHGQKPGVKDAARYNTAMAMRRRYEGQQMVAESVADERAAAGADGRSRGEEASGCGVTIGADNNNNTESPSETLLGLVEAGYNVPRGKNLDSCMQCPECKKRGVWVEKSGRYDNKGKELVDYTCNNSKCKATTKTDSGPSATEASVPRQPRMKSDDSLTEEQRVKASYGADARIRTAPIAGGALKVVYDRRDGSTIAVH